MFLLSLHPSLFLVYISLYFLSDCPGTAALHANTEAWKQNAMAQAYQDQLTAMYAAQAQVLIEAEENSIALTKAQYDLEAATQKQADTTARMKVLYAEAEAAAAS